MGPPVLCSLESSSRSSAQQCGAQAFRATRSTRAGYTWWEGGVCGQTARHSHDTGQDGGGEVTSAWCSNCASCCSRVAMHIDPDRLRFSCNLCISSSMGLIQATIWRTKSRPVCKESATATFSTRQHLIQSNISLVSKFVSSFTNLHG